MERVLEGRDIVCLSSIDWDFLKQRPQQLMTYVSSKNRVLFIEPTQNVLSRVKSTPNKLFAWLKGVRKERRGLYVYTPPPTLPFKNVVSLINKTSMLFSLIWIRRQIKRLGLKDVILYVCHPQWVDLVGRFKEKIVCYDCMDEFEATPGFKRKALLRDMEERLARKADIVLTISEYLYTKLLSLNERTFLVPNGADLDHFMGVLSDKLEVFWQIKDLPPPIIGFIGAIYGWVDLHLIEYIARTHPDWSIVLIGPVGVNISVVKGFRNIHFLGEKRYQELPSIIKKFDVCILPFIVDKRIEASDPIILYDFLASGKPVVSTNFSRALSLEGIIRVAKDKEGFVALIEDCLEENTEDLIQERLQYARENSWRKRMETIGAIINDFLTRDQKE